MMRGRNGFREKFGILELRRQRQTPSVRPATARNLFVQSSFPIPLRDTCALGNLYRVPFGIGGGAFGLRGGISTRGIGVGAGPLFGRHLMAR
jgi:hypothetical protein